MSLQIGYARVDITPEMPVPLAGLGNTLNRISDNTLDRLLSTCLACTGSNGETVLIYTSDLIRAIPAILDRARASISEKYGIAPENIMFSNTHTHSATDYFQEEHEGVIQATEMLIEKFTEAAGLALADRAPAVISAGESHPQTLNFVRHYTKDPETGELTGHPYEPDNQLQLMKITREGAKDIVIMNWQAHPCFTSGYNKHDVSADYIHTFREMIEQETGMLFAFFLGASGDVNTRSRIKSEVIAPDRDTYGKLMHKYIAEALENQKPLEGEKVQILKKELTLEIDHSDDHRIADAQIVVDFWKETYDRKATDAMAKQYGINSPYHANAIIGRSKQPANLVMPVNVAVIGGLGFAFAPYEMFCKNGMFIKENSPCGATVVATCSNAGFSYLADDFAFTEQCYEVDVRRFPRGTAEKLASTFVSMLGEVER